MGAEIRQAEHISLHFLDTEAVLFDSARQCLYSSNTTATFIWCCLEEGMSPSAIAGTMAERFGMTPGAARTAISQALRQWHALKLVGPAAPNGNAMPVRNGDTAHRPQRRAVREPDVRHYRLLDLSIALRCPPPYARIVEPTFAALSATPSAEDDVLVEIVPSNGRRCEIMIDGSAVEYCDGPEEVVPTLKALLVGLILRESRDMAAFHAAGLARGDRCLLLPGASGHGKSTLAAALAMTGFALMSDDTMILSNGPAPAMRTMPFGACLKTGAWSALASRAPQIMDLPVHTRIDGIRVRYLLPPRLSLFLEPARHLPVRWIVFPQYVEGAPLRMREITRTEALRRLMTGCCPLGEPLDAARVARLVEWIADIECHDLRYGDLDEAVALLQLLCA
jgi:hypothetical protein